MLIAVPWFALFRDERDFIQLADLWTTSCRWRAPVGDGRFRAGTDGVERGREKSRMKRKMCFLFYLLLLNTYFATCRLFLENIIINLCQWYFNRVIHHRQSRQRERHKSTIFTCVCVFFTIYILYFNVSYRE